MSRRTGIIGTLVLALVVALAVVWWISRPGAVEPMMRFYAAQETIDAETAAVEIIEDALPKPAELSTEAADMRSSRSCDSDEYDAAPDDEGRERYSMRWSAPAITEAEVEDVFNEIAAGLVKLDGASVSSAFAMGAKEVTAEWVFRRGLPEEFDLSEFHRYQVVVFVGPGIVGLDFEGPCIALDWRVGSASG